MTTTEFITNPETGRDEVELHITKKESPWTIAPGLNVMGTIDGYQFDAMIWPDRVGKLKGELGDSRITTLWLDRDGESIADFSLGHWTWHARTPSAERVAELLSTSLLADELFS